MKDFTVREEESGKYVVQSNTNSVYQFPVYPLYKEPPEELTEIVALCLVNRLEEEGGVEDRDLLGQCHKNSVALFNTLNSNGYTPQLCVGVNSEAGSESSLQDAFKNTKNVHQWVEVDGYTVEICSEGSQSFGHMYVSTEQPTNYSCYLTINPSQFNSLNVSEIREHNIDSVLKELD